MLPAVITAQNNLKNKVEGEMNTNIDMKTTFLLKTSTCFNMLILPRYGSEEIMLQYFKEFVSISRKQVWHQWFSQPVAK